MNVRSTGLGGGLLAIGVAALVAACATTEEVKTASRQSLEKTEEVRASLESKIEQINRMQRQAEEQQADLVKLQKQAQDELSAAQRRGAELETRVQEIKGQDLSLVQGQLETMRRDLDGLQSGLDDQKAQGFALTAKLGGVDKRLEETGKTVGQMTETVKAIGTKLSAQVEQQAQSLAKLEESAKQADGQTRDLSAKVMQFQTALAEFGKVLHGLNDRASEMDRRVAELASKQEAKAAAPSVQESERAARLDAMRKQVEADEQALKTLAAQTEQQTARMAALEKTLGTVVASQKEMSGVLGEMKRVPEEAVAQAAVPADVPPDSPPPPSQRTSIPPAPPRPAGTSPKTAPESAGTVKEAYAHAKSQYDDGQYEDSLKSFRAFLEKYADSALVPNAHFWMAECYIRTRDYEPGIAEFKHVINHYPENEKAADALYQMAMVHLELKDKGAAKIALQQLVNKYPKAEKFNQARTKLASLK